MLLGIDIGTSGVKAALVDPARGVVREHLENQDILTPHPSWAEQDPETWVKNACLCIRAVTSGGEKVDAISFSGQMHGIVVLGKDRRPIRNAIIWADNRSHAEIQAAMEKLGGDYFRSTILNPLAAGFGLASLLWLLKHEPEVMANAAHVLCVKDYVRFRLGGELAQDVADATGTCCMEVATGKWAFDILDRLGLPARLFPTTGKSVDFAGGISEEGEKMTGLPKGTPLYFGGGDQGVASIGAGITVPGIIGSNIGTGGQVTTCATSPIHDKQFRTTTFLHSIPGSWTIFGATLAAGLSLKWFRNALFASTSFKELDATAAKAEPGCDGLLFLPYLAGERTPYMDPLARGMFWGLRLKHGAPEMARAVMEGVCLALRQCFDVLLEAGVEAKTILAMGGGAKSPMWLQMQADMYGMPVRVASGADACLGAAIIAGAGHGIYADVQEGAKILSQSQGAVIEPDRKRNQVYTEKLALFKELYQANKSLFSRFPG